MVISLAFLAAWFPITNKIFPPIPAPTKNTNTVVGATNQAASTTNVLAAAANTNNPAAIQTNLPPREEKLVTIENENALYTFSSLGGGLKQIELKKYKADVGCEKDGRTNNAKVILNDKAQVPALSIVVGGASNSLEFFEITQTGDVVRAEAP